MSVDRPITPPRRGYTRVRQLHDKAALDSDPASCFIDGTSWQDATGVVVIVKGGEAAKAIVELLCAQGFVTPGKGVTTD